MASGHVFSVDNVERPEDRTLAHALFTPLP
jgi:hypothetical protein